MIRAVVVGLGPIGREVAGALIAKGATLLGAADKALAGADVATLVAGAPAGLRVAAAAAEVHARAAAGDVAVLCTASRLRDVAPDLRAAIDAGLHVVSTCEELADPALRSAELAAELDARARARGVAVLGAGVNPGLVMDRLPLLLAEGCVRVDHVRVERVVDAAARRAPLRAKVGAGLAVDAFHQGVAEGRIGHVGLAQSAALVARGLGVAIGAIEETIDPVLDGGRVLGVRQVASVHAAGVERVRLELTMALGAPDPHDRVVIAGDPPLDVRVVGGVPGDRATVGAVVNAALAVGRMAPGLAAATSCR
jgi:4-hydroxy-tetrahydrodipicolinate reductase